jgi:hypothetical protein
VVAVKEEELDAALAEIRRQEDRKLLSPVESAQRRIALLEAHLDQIRADRPSGDDDI